MRRDEMIGLRVGPEADASPPFEGVSDWHAEIPRSSRALPRSVRSTVDFRALAWSAATLDERLEALAEGFGTATEFAPELAAWSKAVAAGNRTRFERRLAWDGWSPARAGAGMASGLPRDWPSPPWLAVLAEVHSLARGVGRRLERKGQLPEADLYPPDRPPPFLEILAPFLRTAERLAEGAVGPAAPSFSPAAIADLKRRLLADLALVSVDALYSRFDRWRTARGADAASAPGRRLYLGFVGSLLDGGLVPLLAELPVLARALCSRVLSWVETTAELDRRWRDDRDALETLFGDGAPLGPVSRVRSGLSDRHRGGRQVARLEVEGGMEIFYKPRPAALETEFQRLLGRLAEAGLEPAPRSLAVLDRGDYGWMAVATPRAAADLAEAQTYFATAGALLCLAKVLRADDLHSENVIAAAGGPVLVDSETLFQPARVDAPPTGLPKVAASQLLTSPQRDALGRLYDSGGLCGQGGYAAAARRRAWRCPNTDAMAPEEDSADAPERENRLRLGDAFVAVDEFRAELRAGYAAAYRFLAAHRERLLAPDGWLEPFRNARTRLLLRPSRVYGNVLGLLARERYQRSGAAAGFLIDALNRGLAEAEQRPLLWSLLKQERQALARGDVPVLDLAVQATEIATESGETIAGSLLRSGFAAVVQEIRHLSEEGLAVDLAELDAALAIAESVAATRGDARLDAVPDRPHALTGESRLSALLLDAATTLGDRLVERAERAASARADGPSDAWLLPEDVDPGAVSLGLYDGAAGAGLFLAALARATGEERFRALAREALSLSQGAAKSDPLGIEENGRGGRIYALVRGGELLGEPIWCAAAVALASDIEPEPIGAPFDVASGESGWLLGLLALAASPSRPGLGAARSSALRLAAAEREIVDRGPGFAHGTAGVWAALGRSATLAAEGGRCEAAAERLVRAIERPSGSDPGLAFSWCRGAAGIGLALATLPEAPRRPEVRRAVERWAARCLAAPPSVLDGACCGQAGRIDFLLAAGRTFEVPEWLDGARRAAGSWVERARRDGGFLLDAGRGAYDPGFFRGLSGIGYLLVRAAGPMTLPSAFALEHFGATP